MKTGILKRILSLAAVASLLISCVPGCAPVSDKSASEEGRLKIVTTIFPEYDWVMNILGDDPSNAEVTMLLDNGVDLHSFQPSADDILKISNCDLFIYVGGESDRWVDDVLKDAANRDMVVINLLKLLGDEAKEEEIAEGMQEEAGDHDDGEEGKEEPEYDEHVWLSLNNAALIVRGISGALQDMDKDNAAEYKANTDAYLMKLRALDEEYRSAVSDSHEKMLVFGDRFPFRYLMDDYGLSYYAAFAGCSAETEASFETISFLAGKVDEYGLHAVMTIDGSDLRIAETIVSNTRSRDQQILTLDSMQSVTRDDVKSGVNYISVMEDNLAVLKKAL